MSCSGPKLNKEKQSWDHSLPVEIIRTIFENVWINTTSPPERGSLYRTLAQVSPAFHEIAARLPPILSIDDESDLALCKEMSQDADRFDKDMQQALTSPEENIPTPERRVARLYLRYDNSRPETLDRERETALAIARFVKDCPLVVLHLLPPNDSKSLRKFPSTYTHIDDLLTSFPSLTHLCLYRYPAPSIPLLPTLVTLRFLDEPMCSPSVWRHLPHTVPNLRLLHITGPLDMRSLALPSKLETLILDLHQPNPARRQRRFEYKWDLPQYRLTEALRAGLFSSTTAETKTIIIRSPPPLHWFEPTQRVGMQYGVRVVQELEQRA